VNAANGKWLQSFGACKSVELSIQGVMFSVDCYALPLDGFDVILGVQWLQLLGPIVWDFAALSMAFERDGRIVRLEGCGATLYSLEPADNLMGTLLQGYEDIFAEPTSLPSPRHHDHMIHLLPGTAPVAVHPYRYPQLLKDKVERQCMNMLAQGVIRPSTSPFSSPVLLVKKSDSSWQFCVDYRALNEKMVQDKFPILVVDELRGTRYFTVIDLRSSYH
jgi:hypothetical protein